MKLRVLNKLLGVLFLTTISTVAIAQQYPSPPLVYVDTAKSLTESLPDGFSMGYLDQAIRLMAEEGQEAYGYKIVPDPQEADFFFSTHINYGEWPNLSKVPKGKYRNTHSIALLIHQGSYRDTVDGRVMPLKAFGEYRNPIKFAKTVKTKFGKETIGNSKIIPICRGIEVDNSDPERKISIALIEEASWKDTPWKSTMANAVFNTFAHYANTRNYYNKELLYPYRFFRDQSSESNYDAVVKIGLKEKANSDQVILTLSFIPHNSEMVLNGRLSAYDKKYILSQRPVLEGNYAEYLLKVVPDIFMKVIFPNLSW